MPATLLFLSGLYRASRRAEGGTEALAIAARGGGVPPATSSVPGAVFMTITAARIPTKQIWRQIASVNQGHFDLRRVAPASVDENFASTYFEASVSGATPILTVFQLKNGAPPGGRRGSIGDGDVDVVGTPRT